MKKIIPFMAFTLLASAVLFGACTKEEHEQENVIQEVDVNRVNPKSYVVQDSSMTFGLAEYNYKGRIKCSKPGENCFQNVNIKTPVNGVNVEIIGEWTQIFTRYSNIEIAEILENNTHLLNMPTAEQNELIALIRYDFVKIVPAYSNGSKAPLPGEIRHFCVIEKEATLAADYSNIIYVLQYSYELPTSED